jgi:hypothetical protein
MVRVDAATDVAGRTVAARAQIIEALYRSLERSQNQLSAAASAWFSHSRR